MAAVDLIRDGAEPVGGYPALEVRLEEPVLAGDEHLRRHVRPGVQRPRLVSLRADLVPAMRRGLRDDLGRHAVVELLLLAEPFRAAVTGVAPPVSGPLTGGRD